MTPLILDNNFLSLSLFLNVQLENLVPCQCLDSLNLYRLTLLQEKLYFLVVFCSFASNWQVGLKSGNNFSCLHLFFQTLKLSKLFWHTPCPQVDILFVIVNFYFFYSTMLLSLSLLYPPKSICCIFPGINTVMYYAASIIKMAGASNQMAVWFSAVTAAINFLFTILGLKLVHIMTRKPNIFQSMVLRHKVFYVNCWFFKGFVNIFDYFSLKPFLLNYGID